MDTPSPSRFRRSRAVPALAAMILVTVIQLLRALSPSVVRADPIDFIRHTVLTPSTPGASEFHRPTTLAIGPEGKLYVGQQDGIIHMLTLDTDRNVTDVGVIRTIYDTPNKNDDGTSAPQVIGRTLLGIIFDPSSSTTEPILYVTHSDPRIGYNNSAKALAIDTHSGMLTRLTGPDYDAPGQREDLVTGLPRSRENHGPNGMAWAADGWLYWAQGGNTNNGAPSTFFSNLPERYLTASVLRANVNSPGFEPVSAQGINGPADELPGIFEVYATGYRNAYDLVWHSNGKLYLNDNGSNGGLGTLPGSAEGCPGTEPLSLPSQLDHLHLVEQGAYGGHPNPARGECVFEDGSVYSPPLAPLPNYSPPLVSYENGASTNGIVEYEAPTFGGVMVGNLIAATYAGDQNLRSVVLSEDGSAVVSVTNLGKFVRPLDVATDADGVIYVAEFADDAITALMPYPPITGAWIPKAEMPIPAGEVGVVEAGGKIYVLGGLREGVGRINAVQVYDPDSNTWSSAAPYPGPGLDHIGAASVAGKVYLVGGSLGFPGPTVKAVYEYDPDLDEWAQKADMPRERGGMGIAVIDGRIYAAGGLHKGEAVDDLTVYDPVSDTWTALAPMPAVRDHLVAEAIDGKLYAIGGRNRYVSAITGANEVYDPASDTWSTRAAMPTPRGGLGSAVLNGRIVTFGGETGVSIFSEVEEYDPETNSWRSLAPMATPRHGTGGAVYKNMVFVPGGGPAKKNHSSTVHEAFTLGGSDLEACPLPDSDPLSTDSDGDGYTDQDELDNDCDPCNEASTPLDFDNDLVSDLNDFDDDNDGIPDTSDQLFFDASNGRATEIPLSWGWNPGDPSLGGIASSGFTGAQISSDGPRFMPENISVGAAGGFLSIRTTEGTNAGGQNSQENALQLGFDATRAFRVNTRVTAPFLGQTPSGQQAAGVFLGLDEDNYVKLVVTADKGTGVPGIQFAVETDGVLAVDPTGANLDLGMPGPQNVDLYLQGDPVARTIWAYCRVDSTGPSDIRWIGTVDASAYPALASFFKVGLPAGVVATHAGTTEDITFGFDLFEIDWAAGQGVPVARINSGGPSVTAGGTLWSADQDYLDGITYTNPAVTEIARTEDDVLYLTERTSSADLLPLNYRIPVPGSGTYLVRLHFAEIYWGAPNGGIGGQGKRMFDVNLEGGAPELEDFDIYAEVGPVTAVVKSFTAKVTDGALDIEFLPGVHRPVVSAIEVLRVPAEESRRYLPVLLKNWPWEG